MNKLFSVTVERHYKHLSETEIMIMLKEFKKHDSLAKVSVEQDYSYDNDGWKSFNGYYNLTFKVTACDKDSDKAYEIAKTIISDIQIEESK